jgi:DnaJ domain
LNEPQLYWAYRLMQILIHLRYGSSFRYTCSNTPPRCSVHILHAMCDPVADVAASVAVHTQQAAYRQLALQWHPDRSPDQAARDRFHEVSVAYTRLVSGVEDDQEHQHFTDSEEMRAFMGMLTDAQLQLQLQVPHHQHHHPPMSTPLAFDPSNPNAAATMLSSVALTCVAGVDGAAPSYSATLHRHCNGSDGSGRPCNCDVLTQLPLPASATAALQMLLGGTVGGSASSAAAAAALAQGGSIEWVSGGAAGEGSVRIASADGTSVSAVGAIAVGQPLTLAAAVAASGGSSSNSAASGSSSTGAAGAAAGGASAGTTIAATAGGGCGNPDCTECGTTTTSGGSGTGTTAGGAGADCQCEDEHSDESGCESCDDEQEAGSDGDASNDDDGSGSGEEEYEEDMEYAEEEEGDEEDDNNGQQVSIDTILLYYTITYHIIYMVNK